MTRKECAIVCLEKFANQKERAVNEVFKYINTLINSENGNPISKNDKLVIISEMIAQIPSNYPILEHSDNQAILQLIQIVKAKIEATK